MMWGKHEPGNLDRSHSTCVSKDEVEDQLFGNGDCSIEQSMENRVAERSTMNPKIESDEKVVLLHSSALFEKLIGTCKLRNGVLILTKWGPSATKIRTQNRIE